MAKFKPGDVVIAIEDQYSLLVIGQKYVVKFYDAKFDLVYVDGQRYPVWPLSVTLCTQDTSNLNEVVVLERIAVYREYLVVDKKVNELMSYDPNYVTIVQRELLEANNKGYRKISIDISDK